jgi:hypothetical protein
VTQPATQAERIDKAELAEIMELRQQLRVVQGVLDYEVSKIARRYNLTPQDRIEDDGAIVRAAQPQLMPESAATNGQHP